MIKIIESILHQVSGISSSTIIYLLYGIPLFTSINLSIFFIILSFIKFYILRTIFEKIHGKVQTRLQSLSENILSKLIYVPILFCIYHFILHKEFITSIELFIVILGSSMIKSYIIRRIFNNISTRKLANEI